MQPTNPPNFQRLPVSNSCPACSPCFWPFWFLLSLEKEKNAPTNATALLRITRLTCDVTRCPLFHLWTSFRKIQDRCKCFLLFITSHLSKLIPFLPVCKQLNITSVDLQIIYSNDVTDMCSELSGLPSWYFAIACKANELGFENTFVIKNSCLQNELVCTCWHGPLTPYLTSSGRITVFFCNIICCREEIILLSPK